MVSDKSKLQERHTCSSHRSQGLGTSLSTVAKAHHTCYISMIA